MKINSTDFTKIRIGDEYSKEYTITDFIYKSFLETFDDRNPLHIDTNYAIDQGYKDKVMHGAILNGFLSHFVGTYFPGKNSLLLTVNIRYKAACYINDLIHLHAKVNQIEKNHQVVVLMVKYFNQKSNNIIADCLVNVMIRKS